jgi:pimeloyl-ACP methyl ester carboxylesterase
MKHLLLLHGAIGSAEQLIPLKDSLQGLYDLHLLNFPGHGGTPMLKEFSIPFFAEYVKEYCASNQLKAVSIFGYSMGGYVALYLARKHPELVQHVITLATKFHWDETVAARERKMLQPEVIEQKVPRFAETLQRRHAPSDWKHVMERTSLMLSALGENNALQPADYATINTPTLVMLGDRDKMVSMEETLAVYKQLPQAQLAILPGTPHPIEQVSTEMLARMITRFLV